MLVTVSLESCWQAFFFSVVSKNYTDKLFACQPIINLLTDKQIPCQAYQKAKNIHALTRKTLVNLKKNSQWTVEAFYCWQVFHLSVISKNKDFLAKISNFIAWQVKLFSTLRVFFEFGMHLACTDKNFSCQWMNCLLYTSDAADE